MKGHHTHEEKNYKTKQEIHSRTSTAEEVMNTANGKPPRPGTPNAHIKHDMGQMPTSGPLALHKLSYINTQWLVDIRETSNSCALTHFHPLTLVMPGRMYVQESVYMCVNCKWVISDTDKSLYGPQGCFIPFVSLYFHLLQPPFYPHLYVCPIKGCVSVCVSSPAPYTTE